MSQNGEEGQRYPWLTKFSIFPRSPSVDLVINCQYNFKSKQSNFHISNQREGFKVNSVAVTYYNKDVKTLVPQTNGSSSSFAFTIDKLDRHVFETTFTVTITYSVECKDFKFPNDKVMLVSTYTFQIPYFQKRT